MYVPLPWDKAKAVERVREELHLSTIPLTDIDIHIVEEVEYLSTPEDVLLKKCFGQNQKLKDHVWRVCLDEVTEIFNKHAAPQGLRVVNYYFLISAVAK